MAGGSISADDFRSLVEKFVDTSNKIDDLWHMERGTDCVYMWKKYTQVPAIHVSIQARTNSDQTRTNKSDDHLKAEEATHVSCEKCFLTEGMEMTDEEDELCMPTPPTVSQVLTYEYHVVYNESYEVPVLYFNVFKQDGKLLLLDEVWNLCPSAYKTYLYENKWGTLTQQEHPLLGRPFFQLHPCHTADLMAQVMGSIPSNRQNYLATWLSTVGPMVGLHISPKHILSGKYHISSDSDENKNQPFLKTL